MTRHAALFALLAVTASAFAEEKKDATTEMRGSVADESLMKQAPDGGVIASAKAMEKLAKAWGIKVPKIDFEKSIVLLATTRGSELSIEGPRLKDGDLTVGFITTDDLRPGFRYLLVVHPRAGVKTVNGKPLPKE